MFIPLRRWLGRSIFIYQFSQYFSFDKLGLEIDHINILGRHNPPISSSCPWCSTKPLCGCQDFCRNCAFLHLQTCFVGSSFYRPWNGSHWHDQTWLRLAMIDLLHASPSQAPLTTCCLWCRASMSVSVGRTWLAPEYTYYYSALL